MANPSSIAPAKQHPLAPPGAARFVDNTARTVVDITAGLGSPIDVNSTDDPVVIPDDGWIHQDPGAFTRSEYYANRQLTVTLGAGTGATEADPVIVQLYINGDNDTIAGRVSFTAAGAKTIEPPGDQITRVTTNIAPGDTIEITAGDTLCAGCRGITLAVGTTITVRLAGEGGIAKPVTLPAGDNYRAIASIPVGGVVPATAQLFF